MSFKVWTGGLRGANIKLLKSPLFLKIDDIDNKIYS